MSSPCQKEETVDNVCVYNNKDKIPTVTVNFEGGWVNIPIDCNVWKMYGDTKMPNPPPKMEKMQHFLDNVCKLE